MTDRSRIRCKAAAGKVVSAGKIRRVELRQTANDTGLLAKPPG